MNPLQHILARNVGNALTPELAWGIYNGYVESVPDTICLTLPIVPAPPSNGTDDPRLVVDDRERVGAWVANKLSIHGGWGGFAAIGMLDKPDGELVAGMVLVDLTKTNAYTHVASVGKHSIKKVMLQAAFDYAFNQLKLKRLTCKVDVGNLDSLRFVQHLGFGYEHTIKCGNGEDVIMFVMWRDKCRWITNSVGDRDE